MAFFSVNTKKTTDTAAANYSLDFLHTNQCKVCPLNNASACHPKMPATGSNNPLIYMLGEGPGRNEDEKGVQFVGRAGRVLRFRIPEDWNDDIRWNNCVRTRPPDNRTPTYIEIECCRPSIIADIEQAKPKAIFGFGNVPLRWALDQARITNWAGRYVPVKIGNHTCWFFPMLHPSFVMRSRKFEPRDVDQYGSEQEFKFALDLANGFKLVQELPDPVIDTVEQAKADIDVYDGSNGDLKLIKAFLREAARCDNAGVDYETNRLRPYTKQAKILTTAVSCKLGTIAFAVRHPHALWSGPQLADLELAWVEFLQSKCRKIAHHLPFEMEWTAVKYGNDLLRAGPWGDTESQAYVLDERRGCLSLDFLCLQYFGVHLKAIANLDRNNLEQAPVQDVLHYNGIDAKYHLKLYHKQLHRLKEEKLVTVYHRQLQRVPTVVLTQVKGVPVHQKTVNMFYDKYCKELDTIEAKIDKMPEVEKFEGIAKHAYQPASWRDVRIMFEQVIGRPLEGTDGAALRPIKHPIARLTIEWRKANKLLGTYVKPLMPGSKVLFPGNMLHPVVSVTSTRTWRTSSEDPNSQNFPKRGPSKIVRSQIRPSTDKKIVAFDYAGIQARNVAMESKDKELVKAFWNRYDIHKSWMEELLRIYPRWGHGKNLKDKEVLKELRHKAKNEFVFPTFFGAQPRSLAKYLGVPEAIAAKLSEMFADKFPGLPAWHKRVKQMYLELGYVTGLTGFRRRAPISPNEMINAPIQADESLIVLEAMGALSELDIQASLEVHDDLTFIWPKDQIERNTEIVITEMIKVRHDWINVPLAVEVSIGDDWYSLKTVSEYSSDKWTGTDPFAGTWADGGGWENHTKLENVTRPGRRLGRPILRPEHDTHQAAE